jgi:hypothetical protein
MIAAPVVTSRERPSAARLAISGSCAGKSPPQASSLREFHASSTIIGVNCQPEHMPAVDLGQVQVRADP